jgi:hypothetical protein
MPDWMINVWGAAMFAALYHVARKLDEIAKLLRDRNSN